MTTCGSVRGSTVTFAVPLKKESELVGAFVIYRQEVRAFTDKQIELVNKLRQSGRHRDREHTATQ